MSIQHDDVAEAVGRNVASVAHLWFEGAELIAVVAAQSVPRSKPHKTLVVLQQLRDVARRHAVLFVVRHHPAQWLCCQRPCRQPTKYRDDDALFHFSLVASRL